MSRNVTALSRRLHASSVCLCYGVGNVFSQENFHLAWWALVCFHLIWRAILTFSFGVTGHFLTFLPLASVVCFLQFFLPLAHSPRRESLLHPSTVPSLPVGRGEGEGSEELVVGEEWGHSREQAISRGGDEMRCREERGLRDRGGRSRGSALCPSLRMLPAGSVTPDVRDLLPYT